MYKNIWEDEPISQEEREIKYDFDPRVNYFALVDEMMPPWTPPASEFNTSYPTDAAFFDVAQREVRIQQSPVGPDGQRRPPVAVRHVPHKRYVRAIDPAGNLCALITSTITPDKERPHGDDGLPTQASVIVKKNRYGWLVVEPGRFDMWNPFIGKRDQDYCAWALAVMKLRKAKHAAHEKAEADVFIDEKKRQALEIANAAAVTQGNIIGQAIRDAQMGAQPSPPPAKK